MTAEDLILLLKRQVCGGAIASTIHTLESPPANDSSEVTQMRSAWFRQLNRTERALLKEVISEAVEQSIFNLLAILDDVAAVNDRDSSDRLELRSVASSGAVLLNNPNHEELHRLFAQTKQVALYEETGTLKTYQVGAFSELRSLMSADDRLHLHRVPIKSAARRLQVSYDPAEAPCIALPQDSHREVEGADPGTKVPQPN